jgi:peptide deformylase
MKRKLVTDPDPRLLIVSKPVDISSIKTKHLLLANDMVETMFAEGGIGISAPQVGENIRVIVVHTIDADRKNGIFATVMFNPEITYHSPDKISVNEGCLSFPNEECKIQRSSIIKVKFFDSNGILQHNTYIGITSICIQHEIDHLDGITMKIRQEMQGAK